MGRVWFPALILSTSAAVTLGGCASTAPSTSIKPTIGPASVRLNDGTIPREQTADSDLSALEQAERDVEMFLRNRKGAQPDATPERIAAARPTNSIQWNDGSSPNGQPPVTPQYRPSHVPERIPSQPPPQPLARSEQVEPTPQVQPFPPRNDSSARSEPMTLEQDRLKQLTVELSRELYREAGDADMPMRELLLIAATSLIDPERAIQPDAVPGLTERERELLAEMQTFFAQLGQSLDGSESADDVLLSAVTHLRETIDRTPPLTIATAALCTVVRGFGDYEPFQKYAFAAHTEQRAIIYLEMEHFTSEANSKGEWITELSQEVTIYSDRDGIPVWSEAWQKAVDKSRNQRQDFFTVQIITLPRALSVGKYQLKIRMRDEKSGALAEESIPFEMVADPKLATPMK